MEKIIYSNEKKFWEKIENIKKNWLESLHVLADFDRTLTKAFYDWKMRPSLISVLRDEWYLTEEYRKKAYALKDKYYPMEIDPNLSLEEKNTAMTEWWNEHLELLVESWLSKNDIDKIISSWFIKLRKWVEIFLKFLSENNIPLLIISANWLWTDSIKLYLENEWFLTKNVHIISNSFEWWEDWKAIWYDKRVIHTFNKWETVLEEFPEIFKEIKDRKNWILLWDSLWDPNMSDWFDFENLVKIWFLNDKEDELIWEYEKRYDLVLTWDSEWEVLDEVLKNN